MRNLIRMNIYRALHTKSMLIIFILALLLAGADALLLTADFKPTEQTQEIQNETEDHALRVIVKEADPDAAFGITAQRPEKENGKKESFFTYFSVDICSGALLIFITIAAVLFINDEEKTGFIKNIAGQTAHKWEIYVSKLIVLALYMLVTLIGYGLVEFLHLKYALGSQLSFGNGALSTCLSWFALQYFLSIAFVCGLAMLTVLCRSAALGIIIGILSLCNFSLLFTGAVERLTGADISGLLLVKAINAVTVTASKDELLHALAVGTVYFIAYNLIGMVWFTKKDVV